jgi:cytochrome c1
LSTGLVFSQATSMCGGVNSQRERRVGDADWSGHEPRLIVIGDVVRLIVMLPPTMQPDTTLNACADRQR